jgi:hypothetical protein
MLHVLQFSLRLFFETLFLPINIYELRTDTQVGLYVSWSLNLPIWQKLETGERFFLKVSNINISRKSVERFLNCLRTDGRTDEVNSIGSRQDCERA